MQVDNFLLEESFAYTGEKENLSYRRDEIGELMKIVAYCQDEAVKEPLEYQEGLWEIYVQEGVTFTEWLYGGGAGSDEDRRRFLEALSKKEMMPSNRANPAVEEQGRKGIDIALGEYPACVSEVQGYVQKRREILSSIKNVLEYEAFMRSCFLNSCFADGILSEMKRISDFPDRSNEITKALGILNDNALELYRQYSEHLEEAMRILSVLLRRECAPDPKHAGDLLFSFTYSEQIEGKTVAKVKEIECSPHLKLLHPGSNLRIYFYWCDTAVGAGKKVLVGRIGRHPY